MWLKLCALIAVGSTNRLVTILLLAALTACGGGGGGQTSTSGSSDPGSPPTTESGASVLSSTTASPTAAASVVDSGAVAVDFASEPSLLGQSATVQRITAPARDAVSASVQALLSADLSSAETVRIALASVPKAVGVTVTFSTGTTYATLADTRSPVVYRWVSAADGDGADGYLPLATTLDAATGAVTVTVPPEAFEPDTPSGYVAHLKLGIADVAEQPATTASLVRALSSGVAPKSSLSAGALSCPLPSGCIETSMFNPKRVISARGSVGHFGVDFRAQTPLAVVAPAGAVIVDALTPAAHGAQLAKSPPKKEWQTGTTPGSGITVALYVPSLGVIVRYLHLSALRIGADGPILNAGSKTTNASFISDGQTPLGWTGATGAATRKDGTSSPHLHFSVYAPLTAACVKTATGIKCKYSKTSAIDPFVAVVKTLKLSVGPGSAGASGATAYALSMTAVDVAGVPVSSDVGSPKELGQAPPLLDATRKLCLEATPASGVVFSTSALATSGLNPILFR